MNYVMSLGGRPTSTLQLACPTCGDEIELECGVNECDGMAEVVSIRTSCDDVITLDDAYDLLMDYGARQAELDTERAGERP